MPPLDNPKRDRFCREYVIDTNGAQAAIRAGYSAGSAKVTASRLLTDDNVQRRIAELQGAVASRLEITHDSVLREIEETRLRAVAAEQHSTALKASELKGKHIGMWPQKSEVNLNFFDRLNPNEQDILERALAESLADTGADEAGLAGGSSRTTH